jgi:hypothetical protein
VDATEGEPRRRGGASSVALFSRKSNAGPEAIDLSRIIHAGLSKPFGKVALWRETVTGPPDKVHHFINWYLICSQAAVKLRIEWGFGRRSCPASQLIHATQRLSFPQRIPGTFPDDSRRSSVVGSITYYIGAPDPVRVGGYARPSFRPSPPGGPMAHPGATGAASDTRRKGDERTDPANRPAPPGRLNPAAASFVPLDRCTDTLICFSLSTQEKRPSSNQP